MLPLTVLLSLGFFSITLFAIWLEDETENDIQAYDKRYSERKTLGSKFTQK